MPHPPLDIQPPADPPPDKTYEITGYTETATDIRANFKLVPLVFPPRAFSKLRLINALMSRNLWSVVRDWLDASGYCDIFLARGLAAGYAVASRPSRASLGAFPKTSAKTIRNSPPPSTRQNPASAS